MGSCQASNKPTLKKNRSEMTKKKPLPSSAPVSPTNSKTIFSGTKLNETAKEVSGCPTQLLRLHKVPLSQHYSVIYEKVPSKPLNSNQAFVQNNLNGKIRIVETLPKSVPEHTEYIQKLIAYNFSHPNVIRVFDIYEDSDTYKIVFENYQGCILSMKSDGHGMLEDNAALIIKQMIDVIHYLHSLKLCHGNLQLGCFSINEQSEHLPIKLLDLKSIFIREPINILNIPYMAPEALRDHQNKVKQRDVWSLGVMAHFLLTGYLPFKGDTVQKIAAEIRRGVVDMSSIQFDKISVAAKEFLSNVIVLSPHNRMDLVSLNKTNWILRLKKRIEGRVKNDLQNMRKQKKLSSLQYCFLQHMANQYQSDQTAQMFQTFNDIDTNKDGKITKYELMNAYQKLYEKEEDAFQIVNEIFSAVDHDSNGEIEISEYILALIDRRSVITEENMKVTFTQLSNKKGFITSSSLTKYFNMKEEQIETELQKMQKKYLNYADFKLCMSDLLS